MMYQGDQILIEKWQNEEKSKRKRSLEPKTNVGQLNEETMSQ